MFRLKVVDNAAHEARGGLGKVVAQSHLPDLNQAGLLLGQQLLVREVIVVLDGLDRDGADEQNEDDHDAGAVLALGAVNEHGQAVRLEKGGQAGGDLGAGGVQGVTAEAEEAAGLHDLAAQDGDGLHAEANEVEADEPEEAGPAQLAQHKLLEAAAGDLNLAVVDAVDLDGAGQGVVGLQQGGDGGVAAAFPGCLGVLGLGAQVHDGADRVAGAQAVAVGEGGLVGARGAEEQTLADETAGQLAIDGGADITEVEQGLEATVVEGGGGG